MSGGIKVLSMCGWSFLLGGSRLHQIQTKVAEWLRICAIDSRAAPQVYAEVRTSLLIWLASESCFAVSAEQNSRPMLCLLISFSFHPEASVTCLRRQLSFLIRVCFYEIWLFRLMMTHQFSIMRQGERETNLILIADVRWL